MKKSISALVAIIVVALVIGVSVTAFAAWGKKQEEQPAPAAQTVPAVPAAPQQPAEYTGEITDDMITSFLKVDRQRRVILQQAEAAVRQTLQAEKLDPQIYIAVAKNIQKDQAFLERVRGVSAKMMEAEMSMQQANQAAAATEATQQ